jgi:hypothetical protein
LAAKGAKKKLGKKKRRQAPLKRGLDSPNEKAKNVG